MKWKLYRFMLFYVIWVSIIPLYKKIISSNTIRSQEYQFELHSCILEIILLIKSRSRKGHSCKELKWKTLLFFAICAILVSIIPLYKKIISSNTFWSQEYRFELRSCILEIIWMIKSRSRKGHSCKELKWKLYCFILFVRFWFQSSHFIKRSFHQIP